MNKTRSFTLDSGYVRDGDLRGAKIEKMFKQGKTTKQIADYFGLPIAKIEEMICTPPIKVLGGFPSGNDRTRSLFNFKHKYGMLKERGAKIPKLDREQQQKIDNDKIERERLDFRKQLKERMKNGK